jgi:hypothetical protein
MKPSVKFAALLIVTLCAAVTFPRLASAQTTSPDAYVYVANRVLDGSVELDGFSADSTGALTPQPGSPFWTSTSWSPYWTLAHTAHWLFLADAWNIYSFSIASNGALTLKSSINPLQFTNSVFNEIVNLVLDRTMSTLYVTEYDLDVSGTGSGAVSILAFKKNATTGALTYLGTTDYPSQPLESRIAFIGNNQYVYSGAWFAAQRNSDGTLSRLFINLTLPSNPSGYYFPIAAAADSANNLAVSFAVWQNGQITASPIAVYTADSSGNLTINGTAMIPTVYPSRMSVSPAGDLLAVGGYRAGLQVFHFSGSNPITPYTKRLAWTNYGLAWDTHKHLYAIENGGVHEWRITPTAWKQATPYPVADPVALAVVSK